MLDVGENPTSHTHRRVFATGDASLTDVTEADRNALRAWIRAGIAQKGVSPTGLAKKIEVATTTITKFLNDPDYAFTPSTPVIAKMERFFGSKAPRAAEMPGQMPAADIEGTEREAAKLPEPLKSAVRALAAGRRGIEIWELHTDALKDDGYYPGDILLIDPHAHIMAGENVLASVMDADNGARRPIFRQYQKPFLVAANAAPRFRTPIEVDDRYVIVKGLILGRISWRHG